MTPNTAVTARTADAADASQAANTSAGAAAAAVRDHQRTLADRLTELADAINDAAADGTPDAETVALFGWSRSDLLPHLKSVETVLLADADPAAAPIAGMIRAMGEAIRRRAEGLESLDDDMTAVAEAGALVALFEAYAAGVTSQLLPALAAAGVDLDAALDDAPELVGHRRAPRKPAVPQSSSGRSIPAIDPIAGLDEVDVRPMPHQARHNVIFGKLQALTDTGEIVITNDHDPKPLRYQTDALWPGVYQWTYLDEGPEEWRVSIVRADGERARVE